MLGAGFPVPPSEATSTGGVLSLVVALVLVVVGTALIIWSARAERTWREASDQDVERQYDKAA